MHLHYLGFHNQKINGRLFYKWRKQLDAYVEDCYKTDPNAKHKPMAVRTSMTGFIDQDWRDMVQDKLKAVKTVVEVDEINTLWPKKILLSGQSRNVR